MLKVLFLLCLFAPLQIVDVGTPQEDWDELACLGSVLASEALSEPPEARRAVLDVLLYRMSAAGTSCRTEALRKYQFSGMTSKKIHQKWLYLYQNCVKIDVQCEKCSHFVREDVSVRWTKKMLYKGKFGKHRFYYENKEK